MPMKYLDKMAGSSVKSFQQDREIVKKIGIKVKCVCRDWIVGKKLEKWKIGLCKLGRQPRGIDTFAWFDILGFFFFNFFLRLRLWNLSAADRVRPCYIQLQALQPRPKCQHWWTKAFLHFTGLVKQPKENGIFAIYSPKSRGKKKASDSSFCTRVQLERTENPTRAMALSAPSDSAL